MKVLPIKTNKRRRDLREWEILSYHAFRRNYIYYISKQKPVTVDATHTHSPVSVH